MTVKCSVIISYYKNLDALELILSALRAQSAVGQFEVIVSEDDDSPSTVSFLHGFSSGSPYEIKHVSQEDKNFRKCMALNQSLKIAEGELIVFLDGDCIPHRRLVGQYLKNMAPKMVLVGRRVDLSKRLSEKILRSKKLKTLTLMQCIICGCRRVEDGVYLPWVSFKINNDIGIVGCNWAIRKQDIYDVNGFDESFMPPLTCGGGEDADVDWRLKKNGCQFRLMKFRSIVYHLYHTRRPINGEPLLAKRIREGRHFCKNGIVKCD